MYQDLNIFSSEGQENILLDPTDKMFVLSNKLFPEKLQKSPSGVKAKYLNVKLPSIIGKAM